MLVILTDEQIISPQKVCPGCLMADRSGAPRWNHGQLGCGHSIGKLDKERPALYECQMGFRIANIE